MTAIFFFLFFPQPDCKIIELQVVSQKGVEAALRKTQLSCRLHTLTFDFQSAKPKPSVNI